MRLFIAVNFEEHIKDKLQEVIAKIEKTAIQGKFVRNEHMHLTLEFLGDIEPSKLDLIKDAMEQLSFNPFTMELSEIGYFKRREENIYWFGIRENDSLLKIQKKLHNSLLEKGFDLESRQYRPHLTIGRKVILNNNFNKNEYIDVLQEIEITINKVDLMKSENKGGKLIHSIVYSKPLK